MLKSLIPGLMMATLMLTVAGGVEKDGWKPTPLMKTVSPTEAKAGDTLAITGEYLDKQRLDTVYLTAGEESFRLEIVSQTETRLVVKIPANVKTGRLRLMVLTTGAEAQFLEQPLIVTVR